MITNDSISELAAIPGVEAVIPRDYLNAGGMVTVNQLEGYAQITGVGLPDLGVLGVEAISGTLALEKGTAIVGAMVKQNFYDPRWRPGMEQPTPPDLMGANVKLTLIKYTQEGTEVRKIVPIQVVSVLAEERGEPDYTMYMSLDDVTAFNEWAMGRRINRNRDGYNMAIVKVADATERPGHHRYDQDPGIPGLHTAILRAGHQ